ncbi:MAG: cell envelope biogenesis protein TolA [Sphingobium sp.]
MERVEKIGLGIASAGHVLLFAALSTSWLSADPLQLRNDPIEVSFADEVALRSAAKKLAEAPPPPAPGEIEGPPEKGEPAPSEALASPDSAPAEPAPALTLEPKEAVKPKPEQKAQAKPSKAATQPTKSRGMLKLDTSDWAKSDSRSSTQTKATDGTLAASIGPAQKSALDAEIRRQLKPHWKAPTGADVEQLRTIVTVRLSREGGITDGPDIVETVGVTASNQAQVRLHQEQAIRAIRLAAPFRLPPDLYDGWNYLRLTFDKRLSQ